ncbi:PTS glucose transporter subunit IIA [Paenibacillus baekrokdamisoli]|uniref:PTS glucose transporter subunit IIA n=1 Tax=Paenibacillus baekrokdamisoli TaxID=1712516 RepID=A0A3G9JG66_9BACL|nr:PTS glucose transporter subunit IIA [Paenibacillus baekrokdamisoli]MBB3069535.1 PTS system glucose-specific IIA component [Paenibacillus baekrokdamisoli]BBH24891.1 PTS glucose transporter subunit IIA [Paenibacillus baekrokdamisoli]
MFGKLFKTKKSTTIDIVSPITGMAVSLEHVPDDAFAGKHMGDGVAIEPEVGKVIAPFNAVVSHIIHTNHAVILEHESGLQVLIHVGINTVALKGEGFKSFVQTGDTVKAGQTLIEFDIDLIRKAGYPIITPVVIANGEMVAEMNHTFNKMTAGSSPIISVVLAEQ